MSQALPKEHFFLEKSKHKQEGHLFIQKIIAPGPIRLHLEGSKSLSNRTVILAGMTPHPVTCTGFLFAEDTYWGLEALRSLGFVLEIDSTQQQLTLIPPSEGLSKAAVYWGRAGTLARFFPAVILNWQNTFPNFPSLSVTASASPQLQARPLAPLLLALQALNGCITHTTLPTTISSSILSGQCSIEGHTSGQFLSGLILAAAGSRHPISIRVQTPIVQPEYVKITLKLCQEFGISLETERDLSMMTINPRQHTPYPRHYAIEPDVSTACYFVGLALLHNCDLDLPHIGSNTQQPDYQFIMLLKDWGAPLTLTPDAIRVSRTETPWRLTLPAVVDCGVFGDQALTLAVLAILRGHAPLTVQGIAHTRHQESNRITSLVNNLRLLGLCAHETSSGFTLIPPTPALLEQLTGIWETHDDHRFGFTGYLLASCCPKIAVQGASCVEKTAPRFFAHARRMGLETRYVE